MPLTLHRRAEELSHLRAGETERITAQVGAFITFHLRRESAVYSDFANQVHGNHWKQERADRAKALAAAAR
jgi:hypothetical protein